MGISNGSLRLPDHQKAMSVNLDTINTQTIAFLCPQGHQLIWKMSLLYSTTLNLLGALVVICVLLHIRTKRRLRRIANPHNLPFPPGPLPLPIIGNLWDIPKEQESATYFEWAERYGILWAQFCHEFQLTDSNPFHFVFQATLYISRCSVDIFCS